jgi:hypothetical protein
MRCLDVLRFEVGVIGEHFVPAAPWANGPTVTETGMRQPRIQALPPRILQSKAMRSSIVSLLLNSPRHYHKKTHCETCSFHLWAGSSTLQCVSFGLLFIYGVLQISLMHLCRYLRGNCSEQSVQNGLRFYLGAFSARCAHVRTELCCCTDRGWNSAMI